MSPKDDTGDSTFDCVCDECGANYILTQEELDEGYDSTLCEDCIEKQIRKEDAAEDAAEDENGNVGDDSDSDDDAE